jgi:hypothetical protein
MTEKNLKLAEKYLEQIRNLDVEFKVYEKIRHDAICKRNRCVAYNDQAGALAWEKIRNDCAGKRLVIRETIKELYWECIRLESEVET